MSVAARRAVTAGAPSEVEERSILFLASGLVATSSGRNYAFFLNSIVAGICGIKPVSSARGGWPSAQAVMRRKGFSLEEIEKQWFIAENSGSYVLPEATIHAFFPPEILPGLWQLIEMGPRKFVRKFELFLTAGGRGLTLAGAERPRGAISESGSHLYFVAVKTLHQRVRELIALAEDEDLNIELPPEFEQWGEQFPKLRTAQELGLLPAKRDTSAPSLQCVRRALRAADADVQRRKATSRQDGLLTALRDRALLALMIFGPRAETLEHILVRDVLVGEGAVLFRKFKGKRLDQVKRKKKLPKTVIEWIVEYIEYAGLADTPEHSLWKTGREHQREAALPSPNFFSIRAEAMLRGHNQPGDREKFNPHSYRHFAEIYAFRAGSRWIEEHLDQVLDPAVKGVPASAQTFADILLDHKLHDITDRYKDLDSEPAREQWAAVAAEGVWEWAWGEAGATKSYDVRLIEGCQQELKEALAREAQQASMLEAYRKRKIEVEAERQQRRQQTIADADGLSEREMFLRLLESEEAGDEISRLGDRISDCVASCSAAAIEVERARQALAKATEVRISIPDEVDVAEVEARVATIFAEEESRPEKGDPDAAVVRRWVDTQELHWATEHAVSLSQLKRLMHGKSNYQHLFRPNPNGGDPLGIDRTSERRPRIYVDELPLERYPERVVKRLRWLMTQEWPVRDLPEWSDAA